MLTPTLTHGNILYPYLYEPLISDASPHFYKTSNQRIQNGMLICKEGLWVARWGED